MVGSIRVSVCGKHVKLLKQFKEITKDIITTDKKLTNDIRRRLFITNA